MNRIKLIHLCFPPVLLGLGMLLGATSTLDSEPGPRMEARLSTLANPIERNQETDEPALEQEAIFVDWAAPDLALFISGRQDGYIEPCGCTGLENQLGGMMRRHTLLNQLKEAEWEVMGIDTGNQVKRFGHQANLKLATTYQCIGEDLKYAAVGFGPQDLKLPSIELIQAMANSGIPEENFVAANVTIFDESLTRRHRVLEQAGKRIGLTMILGDEHFEKLAGASDITLTPVNAALNAEIANLRAAVCDLNVLVANTSLEKCQQMAMDFPFFDLLVCCGVDGEPTRLPEPIKHETSGHVTQIIQTGNKGMYVGVVGLFNEAGGTKMRYQRVPLDARFEDSEPIKKKFFEYQEQLRTLGLKGLGVKPVTHPSGRNYVGSEACYDCHDTAYDIWKDGVDGNGGPHSRATADLTDPGERTWVQRHFDPECLSCHVTGWNPQEYFPYETGYLKLEDELLHGNGCENCHGPGSMHVAAENGDIDVSEELREQYFKELIVTLEQAKTKMCQSCHDLDNSPDFHKDGAFDKYWDQIKHYEDDE